MAAFRVVDLERNKPDASGAIVLDIYSKIGGVYAVYRTEERVMIQFADDQELGSKQRQSLAELYVLRGKINSLLEELRDSSFNTRKFNDSRYVRLMADALIVALQGQVAQAKVDLEAVYAALSGERSSRIRMNYLLIAALCTVGLIVIIRFVASNTFTFNFDETAKTFLYATCVGMVGAFTSVAFAIRGRELDTEKPQLDMIGDAILRIFVGGVTAVMLMSLIKIGAFGLEIGGAKFTQTSTLDLTKSGWPPVLIVAFFAGWTQRLLPELFAKASVVESPAPPPPPAAGQADERNPMGRPATGGAAPAAIPAAGQNPPPDEIDDPAANESDSCDNHAHDGCPVTEDVELPETVCGVEGRA